MCLLSLHFCCVRDTRSLSTAEDGYQPSEDEDDHYSGKVLNRRAAVLANFTQKRRKKKRRRKLVEKEEENLEDPLVVFGWDIMLMILGRLDASSVALSLLVSRSWHGVASSDALWSKKTQGSRYWVVLSCFLLDDTQENIKKGGGWLLSDNWSIKALK